MKKNIFYITILFFLNGCGGDYVEDLPKGFQFVSESNINTFIVGDKIIIPCQVIEYKYNQNFIIALQVYVSSNKCFEKGYEFNQIEGKEYYWIVDLEKNKLIGPFDNKSIFIKKKKKLNIELKL